MSDRRIVKVPPGISSENLKGGGTSGLVAAWPGQTAIKFPHGEPDDILRCVKEGDIYERFENVSGRRPSSLLEYRGRTEQGILLEFAERGSIREYYRNANPMPSVTILLCWARQAAEALAFCHAHGVLHGDINCSNFFLTKDLDLKVGDFTSSAMDESTTSLYSITHQLPDADITTQHTEIFAFGSSVYEMATGTPPFVGLDDEDVEHRFRQKQFPDLSDVKMLKEFISRCWSLRFDSMNDVLEAINSERRGVYATADIPAKTVIETSPVIVLDPLENQQHVEHTQLLHYTYNWPYHDERSGKRANTQAIILGLGSMFNHSTLAQNVGWERDVDKLLVRYTALRDISQGISYGARLTFQDADVYAVTANEADALDTLNRIEI
ncbi:MAG: hypothetical protein M1817_004023 [Caeruleum heppii]|nr:MAG: hypothetical protein M1817_004023 [Caeruleum heppii]